MMDLIKKIMYEKNMHFSSPVYFQMEILTGNRSTVKFIDSNQEPQKITIDDIRVEEFIDKFLRTIDNWNASYNNNSILDGAEWKLQIIYNNEKIKKYEGNNEFPSNFTYFEELIKKMMVS